MQNEDWIILNNFYRNFKASKEKLVNFTKYTDLDKVLRRPQKFDEISQFIWNWRQINWKISLNIYDLPRKPQLYLGLVSLFIENALLMIGRRF